MLERISPHTGKFEDERFKDVRFVVIKITHRCNLNCSYCYEDDAPGTDMDLALFRHLTSKVIRNTDRPLVRFVLHGGEPSLIDKEWLIEAVGFIQTESRVFGKAVKVGMQSNLLALDDAKLNLLKKLNITLGASIDGPEDIPGAMRPLAAKAIEKYKLACSLGVRIGLLMTVNSSNWNYYGRIMRWLHEEMGVRLFRVNTVTPVGKGKYLPRLKPEQIFKAHRDIIDYMIESGGELVEENLMREMRKFVGTYRDPADDMLCDAMLCGAGRSVMSVTPEGNILPCGRFSWNDSDYFIGNVRDRVNSGAVERSARVIAKFHGQSAETWSECELCHAKRICSFGCRCFVIRSRKKANIDCLPTQKRYEYFNEKKSELQRLLDNIDEASGRMEAN